MINVGYNLLQTIVSTTVLGPTLGSILFLYLVHYHYQLSTFPRSTFVDRTTYVPACTLQLPVVQYHVSRFHVRLDKG